MDKCCEGKELVGPYKSGGYIVYICEGCGTWRKNPMLEKVAPKAYKKIVPSHALARKEALAADAYIRED